MRLFDLWFTFFKIGMFSFGSATSEVILEQVVEKKKWVSIEDFRDCLSMSALVPGPFHVNLAAMTGYLAGGFAGSLAALTAFCLPGAAIAALIAIAFDAVSASAFFLHNPGITTGMRMAMAALVLNVIVRMGRRTLPAQRDWLWVAVLAALLIAFRIPFAAVLLVTGAAFVVYARRAAKKASTP